MRDSLGEHLGNIVTTGWMAIQERGWTIIAFESAVIG
jgi:hypothetical protein